MKFILLLFFVLLTSSVFAQQSKTSISGTVIDKTSQQPIQYVSVTLLHPTDNATVTGTVTDKKGKFTLQQIPANSSERIEVITNPSARYRPDGTSGIINIVLKKNSKAGLMMIIHMTFL